MELEGSLPLSQNIATFLYPYPDQFRSPLYFLKIRLKLSTDLHLCLPSSQFPSGSPAKNLNASSSPPHVPRASHISSLSILSPEQNLVWITDHQAPDYALFSAPLSLRLSLRPTIFLSTMFSNTLNTCPFLGVIYQVSRLNTTKGKNESSV
jgi:hypothetical protein